MTRLPSDRMNSLLFKQELTEEDRETHRTWARRWWIVSSAIVIALLLGISALNH